jgi:hypothetical protein
MTLLDCIEKVRTKKRTRTLYFLFLACFFLFFLFYFFLPAFLDSHSLTSRSLVRAWSTRPSRFATTLATLWPSLLMRHSGHSPTRPP